MLKNSGKKRPRRGLFLFLIITNIIICQKSPEPFISNIKWQGNTKTEDYIIRREIRHSLNTPFDSTIAIEDRNRIDNLGLFSETSWQVVQLEDGTSKLVSFGT